MPKKKRPNEEAKRSGNKIMSIKVNCGASNCAHLNRPKRFFSQRQRFSIRIKASRSSRCRANDINVKSHWRKWRRNGTGDVTNEHWKWMSHMGTTDVLSWRWTNRVDGTRSQTHSTEKLPKRENKRETQCEIVQSSYWRTQTQRRRQEWWRWCRQQFKIHLNHFMRQQEEKCPKWKRSRRANRSTKERKMMGD